MDQHLDAEASDNKKATDALLNVGRQYLAVIFTEIYNAIHGKDWVDTLGGAKSFVQILPKGYYKKNMNVAERQKVTTGSIDNWDITLLGKLIKLMADKHKTSLPGDIWEPKLKKVENMLKIRNEASHATPVCFKGQSFRTLFVKVRAVLLDLGCSEGRFEDIWKTLMDTYTNTLPYQVHRFPQPTIFFDGRDEALWEIEKAISSCEEEKTVYGRIIAIVGFAGMGKSEVAKVMARKLKSKYDIIFYFDAQTRTSLEPGFRTLASLLKLPLQSDHRIEPADITRIYLQLAENYTNILFIFDNAEVLASKDNLFGIEKYLQPEVDCNKPVFLVTSRNPWGDVQNPIKCIQLDRLTEKESRRCLLRYLSIENSTLPESLNAEIENLAEMLEGHPLGISLVGLTLAHNVENIPHNGIESRVTRYTRLLADDSIQELPGQRKYEVTLDAILDTTIKAIEGIENGDIALELLTILAHLSPDNIYVGLLNGIYSNEPFEPEVFCPKFLRDDCDIAVCSGLKILLKFSLVTFETFKVESESSPIRTHDMVKIHRLIQEATLERNLLTREVSRAFQKIVQFFEYNVYNEYFVDHIWKLVLVFVSQDFDNVDTSSVLKLTAELGMGFVTDLDDLAIAAEYLINNKNLTSIEWQILRFLELCFLALDKTTMTNDEDGKELSDFMLGLPSEITEQYWIIKLCVRLLKKIHSKSSYRKNIPVLLSWLIDRYIECPQSPQQYFGIIECMLECDRDTESSKLQEVLCKAVSLTKENKLWSIWPDLTDVTWRFTLEKLTEIFQPLLPPAQSFFTRSIQFRTDRWKEGFVIAGQSAFFGVLFKLAGIKEHRESLSLSDGFAEALVNITDFSIKHLSEYYPGSKRKKSYCRCAEPEQERILILATWCRLFCFKAKLYRSFGEAVDRIVSDWLLDRREVSRSWGKFSNYVHQDQLDAMEEFRWSQHCTGQTKKWILELRSDLKPM